MRVELLQKLLHVALAKEAADGEVLNAMRLIQKDYDVIQFSVAVKALDFQVYRTPNNVRAKDETRKREDATRAGLFGGARSGPTRAPSSPSVAEQLAGERMSMETIATKGWPTWAMKPMPFGKYRRIALGRIAVIRPDYIRWLFEVVNPTGQLRDALTRTAQWAGINLVPQKTP